jgi:hypothetical protein
MKNEAIMKDAVIRILYRSKDGLIQDFQDEHDLSRFAGTIPIIGDQILDPGVVQGKSRYELQNRRLLSVVGRVFNPRDNENYIALIVEERAPTELESELVGSG